MYNIGIEELIIFGVSQRHVLLCAQAERSLIWKVQLILVIAYYMYVCCFFGSVRVWMKWKLFIL